MIEKAVLTDDDPVELLEGLLACKTPKNPGHRIALAKLHRALAGVMPESMSIQLQDPITLADGEPEPDAAVIRGQPEDYSDRHPGAQDVLLVIEVADTTVGRDRGIKLRSYARAGIAHYWILNLVDRSLETYWNPDSSGASPVYGGMRVLSSTEGAKLQLGDTSCGEIRVADLLP